eukprot:scaffold2070_cov105-Cylindrotheca_fusiformis.AAC.7
MPGTLESRLSTSNGTTNGGHHPLLLKNGSRASSSSKNGVLEVTILSAYDLPLSEAPTCIRLQVGDNLVEETGPPLAKHKDRNSFRFSKNNNNESNAAAAPTDTSTVQLKAPLPVLYKSKLTVRVMYNKSNNNKKKNEVNDFTSVYDLNQLRIHERKWVILTLTDESATTSTSTTPAASFSTGGGLPEDDLAPTIRVILHLSGPYRPEIAALISIARGWFGVVDGCQDNMIQVWKHVPELPFDMKYLAVPAVPVLATLVVVSPVLAGVMMVGLPFLLPVILSILGIVGSFLVGGGCLYGSSREGRAYLGNLLHPITESLVHSRVGQKVVYETGPRPTPVSMAKLVVPTNIWSKLAFSLFIDLVGASTFLLPGVGEIFDLFWAPMQTVLIMAMYESTSPNLKYVSFVEEVLPFTDIVPSATIGWTMQYLIPELFGNHSPEVERLLHTLARKHPERTTANVPNTSAH